VAEEAVVADKITGIGIKIITALAILLGLLALTACDDGNATGHPCIEADDFGFIKVVINSKGYNVTNDTDSSPYPQTSEWNMSGLRLNGQRVVATVSNDANSRWIAWLGNLRISSLYTSAPKCTYFDSAGLCPISTSGVFEDREDVNFCPNANALGHSTDEFGSVCNQPCWFYDGEGAYMLVTNPGNAGLPNDSHDTIINPTLIGAKAFHLGERPHNNLSLAAYAGGINKPWTYFSEFITLSGNGTLYFKIYDRYYEDNYGSYTVIMKSGVSNIKPGPIGMLLSYVQQRLLTAAGIGFRTFVQLSSFTSYIRVLLTLYIICVAAAFVLGMVEMSQKELMTRVLKIAVVVALIGPDSWNFFSTHLFNFFVYGAVELSNLVATGEGGNASTYDFFDGILGMMMSHETGIKIMCIARTPTGFLFLIFYVLAIVLVLIMVFKAVIMIMLGMIATSLLILIGPLFISFMLFQHTYGFFDGWLKMLFAYFLQPIIIAGAMGLTGAIILAYFQKLLGFPVCWQTWLTIIPGVLALGWYAPGPFPTPHPKALLPVPNGHTNVNGGSYTTSSGSTSYATDHYCMPYECYETRYVDLPFLIPATGTGGVANVPNDQSRIDDMFNGIYVHTDDCFNFLLIIYLLYQFNTMVPQLAQALSGGVGTAGAMSQAANAAMKNMAGLMNMAGKGANMAIKKLSGGKVDIAKGIEYAKRGLNAAQQYTIGAARAYATHGAKKAGRAAGKLAKKAVTSIPVVSTILSPAVRLGETMSAQEKKFNAVRDGIGRTVELFMGSKDIRDSNGRIKLHGRKGMLGMVKDHVLNKATMGGFGKDAFEKDDNGMTDLKHFSGWAGDAFGLDREGKQALEGKMGDLLKSSVGAARSLAAPAALAAVSGPAALAAGGAAMAGVTPAVNDLRSVLQILNGKTPPAPPPSGAGEGGGGTAAAARGVDVPTSKASPAAAPPPALAPGYKGKDKNDLKAIKKSLAGIEKKYPVDRSDVAKQVFNMRNQMNLAEQHRQALHNGAAALTDAQMKLSDMQEKRDAFKDKMDNAVKGVSLDEQMGDKFKDKMDSMRSELKQMDVDITKQDAVVKQSTEDYSKELVKSNEPFKDYAKAEITPALIKVNEEQVEAIKEQIKALDPKSPEAKELQKQADALQAESFGLAAKYKAYAQVEEEKLGRKK